MRWPWQLKTALPELYVKRSMKSNFKSNNLYPKPVTFIQRKNYSLERGLFGNEINKTVSHEDKVWQCPKSIVWNGLRP